jgi:BASS family bile acid:Na+ symporter
MEIVTKIAPICLVLIMLGLGLGLSLKDFTRVLRTPKDFFIGFFSQLLILPIIALGIALILDLSAPIAVGLMIIAAAPGGVTSNVLTKFADGDVALSISLTAIVSLISIISVPFVVINSAEFLGVVVSKNISMAGIALKIIGMIVRGFAENFISSKINIINKLTGWLFIIVFAAIWIEEKDNVLNYLAQAGLAVLILNVVMMLIAYFIAKKFVSGIAQQKCIALECGLQNGTLAVFVATLMFDDITYVIPTAAYALTMYITGFIFIYILKKSN